VFGSRFGLLPVPSFFRVYSSRKTTDVCRRAFYGYLLLGGNGTCASLLLLPFILYDLALYSFTRRRHSTHSLYPTHCRLTLSRDAFAAWEYRSTRSTGSPFKVAVGTGSARCWVCSPSCDVGGRVWTAGSPLCDAAPPTCGTRGSPRYSGLFPSEMRERHSARRILCMTFFQSSG